MNVSVYEPLRAGEKSQPVHNVANASYSHIGRQSEPADTHVLRNMQIHNMRVRRNVIIMHNITLMNLRMITMFWIEMRCPCVPVPISMIHVNRCMAILMR